ncbi:MAG TPA: hypothetical protein VGH53_32355 [Streptosporangiaceae bacterium]
MGHETCALDLTRQEVAERAARRIRSSRSWKAGSTSQTSRWLKRILAVLDERPLIGIERTAPGEEHDREIAPAPEVLSA